MHRHKHTRLSASYSRIVPNRITRDWCVCACMCWCLRPLPTSWTKRKERKLTWTVVVVSYLNDLVCPFSRNTFRTFAICGTHKSPNENADGCKIQRETWKTICIINALVWLDLGSSFTRPHTPKHPGGRCDMRTEKVSSNDCRTCTDLHFEKVVRFFFFGFCLRWNSESNYIRADSAPTTSQLQNLCLVLATQTTFQTTSKNSRYRNPSEEIIMRMPGVK